jgi:hypothetical protein
MRPPRPEWTNRKWLLISSTLLSIFFAIVVDWQDIGMFQSGDNPGFLLEAV